jgi:hypothetical protein
MATHVFKGNIKVGTVSATFLSDFSNVDPDLLIARYADSAGGNAQVQHVAIAPGGSGTVTITPPAPGLLEVLVDTGHDDESGRLQVANNGTTRDDESIKGPMRWVYTVIA